MALTPLNKHTYVFRGEPVSSANLNEIQDRIVEMQTEYTDPADVGDVADLETTATEIVGAINEVLGDVGTVDGRVTTLDTKADTINGNISDAYSASSTYKVGELCIYNNALYRCTTAITTAEAWTAAHWTATTIAEEIENRVLWFPGVTVSATTGNIVAINDSRITTAHVLASCTWGSDSSITALTSWSTETAGQLTINGTCSAATTADILLVKKNN